MGTSVCMWIVPYVLCFVIFLLMHGILFIRTKEVIWQKKKLVNAKSRNCLFSERIIRFYGSYSVIDDCHLILFW